VVGNTVLIIFRLLIGGWRPHYAQVPVEEIGSVIWLGIAVAGAIGSTTVGLAITGAL